MRDSRNKTFPSVLIQPRVVSASSIWLNIVEAGDGGECDSGIEERPSIYRLDSTVGVCLIDVGFEERSSTG